jgi:hypothetical protein
MAAEVTQLQDVVIPEIYANYMDIDSPEVTRFFDSGVVQQNALLNNLANSGGNILTIPFWRDLDADVEPNLSNDDPEDLSTPNKIIAGSQVAMVGYFNQSWSAMDLVSELAGDDPMSAIVRKTNRYWGRQWQRRLISACTGILLDNVANHDSDMVKDVFSTGATPDEDNIFGGEAYIDAELTLGDQIGVINAIAMHSVIYGQARKADLIEFIPDSQGRPGIPTYMGKIVIVDDGMPVVEIDGHPVFTTVLFGNSPFGFGVGNPRVPVEIERKPDGGKGGGQEVLYERRTWLLHPFGYALDPQAISDQSPSLTEYAAAATWERVVDRKNVPLAFLRTNGAFEFGESS